MIKRTICCAICNYTYTEDKEGAGFPDWGALHGIVLNGIENPHLCPNHLGAVAEFIDKLADAKLLKAGN